MSIQDRHNRPSFDDDQTGFELARDSPLILSPFLLFHKLPPLSFQFPSAPNHVDLVLQNHVPSLFLGSLLQAETPECFLR